MNAKMNDPARQKLPPHERDIVTDDELRCAKHVSDAEFFDRIAMPSLFGQRPRFTERGRS